MNRRRGTFVGGTGENGPLSFLTREQDRALRAKAWRHVRRINPKVARRVWRNRRAMQEWQRAMAVLGL